MKNKKRVKEIDGILNKLKAIDYPQVKPVIQELGGGRVIK
jgi:hypothetical protein